MSQDTKNFKCASSLAVFRKMYENRQNIYDVISGFAKIIIVSKNLTTFELYEMCSLLKEEYGVWLVPAVVKTALKKLDFLKREKNVYTLIKCLPLDDIKTLEEQIQQSKDTVSSIIDEYIDYKKTKDKSAEIDESLAREEFCKFVIDGNAQEDSVGAISAFIVERKGNSRFEQACRCISEGVIIYNGLSYTVDGELVEKFDTPLTVFLETELLFHAAGLNGTLYKSLFDDFYKIVSEINCATQKQYGKSIISLAYFPETQEEVNNYFKQAETIFRNQGHINRSKPAMCTILKGCNGLADVKQKEIQFWSIIRGKGIKIDDTPFDVTNDYYAKYNLSTEEDVEEFNGCEDGKKAYDIGQMMSKVNFIRRNTNRGVFRLIKAILLTGNRKTLSFSDKKTQSKDVPYATTLSYLTNRFWYSLHKGIFKDGATVPGTNIFTMAQVAFSQRINEGLTLEYKKIKQQLDEETITQESANEIIAGFKVDYLKPENVTKELVDNSFCFDIFNGDAIEQAKAERTLEKQQHAEEISLKDKELVQRNQAIDRLLKEKNERERNEYNEALKEYNESKREYVRKQSHEKGKRQRTIAFLYIIFFFVSVVLACLCKQNLLGGILSLLAVVFPVIERFVRPLVNTSICEALKWTFSRNTYKEYEECLVKKYEMDNQKPELSLSTIEDYIK